MHEPRLLILDEPTSGLDPLVQKRFYEILLEENQKGVTIFFSSHVLSEVQKLCHRVAILKEGRVLRIEEIEALRSWQFKKVQVTFKSPAGSLPENLEGIVNPKEENGAIRLLFNGGIDALVAISAFVAYMMSVYQSSFAGAGSGVEQFTTMLFMLPLQAPASSAIGEFGEKGC